MFCVSPDALQMSSRFSGSLSLLSRRQKDKNNLAHRNSPDQIDVSPMFRRMKASDKSLTQQP